MILIIIAIGIIQAQDLDINSLLLSFSTTPATTANNTLTGYSVQSVGQTAPIEIDKPVVFLDQYMSNVNDLSVDSQTGMLVYSKKDLVLPLKQNMKFAITRTYSSFLPEASPCWLPGYDPDWLWKQNNFMESVGWIGRGWQLSVGGKLIVVDMSGQKRRVIVSVENSSCEFIETTTGVFDYVTKKTQASKRVQLKPVNNPNGFVFSSEAGDRYYFYEQSSQKTYKAYRDVWWYCGFICLKDGLVIQSSRHDQERVVDATTVITAYFISKVIDKNDNVSIFNYKQIGDSLSNTDNRVIYANHYESRDSTSYDHDYPDDGCPIHVLYKYWYDSAFEQRTYTFVPKRIDSILLVNNKKLSFDYVTENMQNIGAYQISKIRYADKLGQEQSITYGYDQNNYLTSCILPNGLKEIYSYSAVLGNCWYHGQLSPFLTYTLLTGLVDQKGYSKTVSYNIYDPVADAASTSPNPGYNYLRYTVNSIKEDNGNSLQYTYTGSHTYKNIKGMSTDLGSNDFCFNKVTVQDNLSSTEYDYTAGQLVKEIHPLNLIKEYTYDTTSFNLIKENETHNGYVISKEYKNYDAYDYPGVIIEYGKPNTSDDDRQTVVKYQHIDTNPNLYMLGLVTEQWHANGTGGDIRDYERNVYDASGNVTEHYAKKDGTELKSTYAYYPDGQIKQITMPNGAAIIYTYDAYGYLKTQIKTFGTLSLLEQYSFNQYTGNLEQIIGPNGETNSYDYDVINRLIKEVDPTGIEKAYIYDDANLHITAIEKKTVPLVSDYWYYKIGTLKKKTLPGNETFDYTYDVRNRLIDQIHNGAVHTTYTYDVLDRKLQTKLGNRLIESDAYFDNDLHTEITDGKGAVKKVYANPSGGVEKIMLPNNTVWNYQYDYMGNVVKVTDAKNNDMTSKYDANNKLIEENYLASGDGRKNTYTYDNDYNLISFNKNGIIKNMTYDLLGRMLTEESPRENKKIMYAYDLATQPNALGKLAKVVDDTGTILLEYDKNGRIVKKLHTINGVTYVSQTLYDDLAAKQTYINPLGRTQILEYGADGKLNRNSIQLGAQSVPYATYAYANGLLQKVSLANGVSASYTYDAYERIAAMTYAASTGNPVYQQNFTYDNNDNITSLNIKDIFVPRGRDFSYQYDVLNQLTNEHYPNKIMFNFSFDAKYNRTAFDHAFGSVAYTYNNRDNLTEYNDCGIRAQFGYDANNTLKSIKYLKTNNDVFKQNEYTFDSDECLTNYKATFQGAPETDIVFVYDYQGNRVKKQNKLINTNSLYFFNNPAVMTAEQTPSAEISYVYGNSAYAPEARVVKKGTTETLEYFVHDHLGNIVEVLDATGNILNRYYYDPYGNLDVAVEKVPNNLRYGSKLYDDDLKLYYFGARWYDPVIGRFIADDPEKADVKNPFSFNNYLYCNNNPERNIDPDGNKVIKVALLSRESRGMNTETIYRVHYFDDKVAYKFVELNRKAAYISKQSKRDFSSNDSLRTLAQQAAPRATGANPQSDPWNSRHTAGFANDLNYSDSRIIGLAASLGFTHPTYDPPHFSLNPVNYGYSDLASAIMENQADYNRILVSGGKPVFAKASWFERLQTNVGYAEYKVKNWFF